MNIENIINKNTKHEPVIHYFINISISEIIQSIWNGAKNCNFCWKLNFELYRIVLSIVKFLNKKKHFSLVIRPS